jgi:hypothetical protein
MVENWPSSKVVLKLKYTSLPEQVGFIFHENIEAIFSFIFIVT